MSIGTYSPRYAYNPPQPMTPPSIQNNPMAMQNQRQLPLDSEGRVADGKIRLRNSSKTIPITADMAGNLFQRTFMGDQCLGKVEPYSGNYRLISGQAGNIFLDEIVTLTGYQNDINPFALALNQAERSRAVQGSEIPMVRQSLTSMGLNGQGLKMGILDSHEKEGKKETWKTNAHAKMVAATVSDPVWGVAPGAQVQDMGENSETVEDIKSDNVQELFTHIVGQASRYYQERSTQLQKIISQHDPSLRVLNSTKGGCDTRMYNSIWYTLNQHDENRYYKFPQLRATVLGETAAGTSKQQFQAVMNYVDKLLDQSPVLQQAHQQYIEMTRQAAQAGIIIVVAAGNERHNEPYNLPQKPGSELGNYAKSPYVITVAAANTNQTPGQFFNYKIAPFSSRGDGIQWNPTIAVPGSEMPVSFPIENMGHNFSINGTSFATPFTCGVILLMLQRNPNLTFDQIKAKLQSAAIPLPGYTVADQGAGVLNPIAAVTGP